MTPQERVALEERRECRESWRRSGGSHRRPLKSFATADEKRANRDEHAERIHAAVSWLHTEHGFAAWVESLELNPDVSALNAALIAHQLPHQLAGTAAFWQRNGYRIRRGEGAAGWITGPLFYPRAVFTADQADADDLAQCEPEGVAEEHVTAAVAMFRQLIAEHAKGREACEAAARRLGLRE